MPIRPPWAWRHRCASQARWERSPRIRPNAGENGHDGFRDHRHVDDDAIAVGHAVGRQRAGEQGNLVAEFAVADAALRVGDRAVVDDRCLVAAAGGDVPVDGIVAGIELTPGEPSIDRRIRIVEDAIPAPFPVDALCRFAPKVCRVLDRTPVDLRILAHGSPAFQLIPAILGNRRPRGHWTKEARRAQ